MHEYDDIIDYNWTGSLEHERMPLSSRARIFLPFSALSGFDELIDKTAEQKIVQ